MHALRPTLAPALLALLLAVPADAEDGRFLNLSTRAQVGTGGDVMVSGFVVSPGAPKTVLIRAVGPTLAAFGLTGVLVDPTLVLFDGAGKPIAANDNWAPSAASAFVAAGAFALPANSKDAALVTAALPPGNYTVQVAGVGDTTGAALVEVYDLTGKDLVPPSAALTAPVGGATVSGAAVVLTAAVGDNVGLAGVQFRLNNTIRLGAELTAPPYRGTWDTTTLENGVYQLTTVARDLTGHTTVSAPVAVFVNNATTAGAVIPWTTYEAERASRPAGATLQTGGTWGQSGLEAAFEARGKQCVVLNSVGEFVEWTNVVGANRVTVRYALPAVASTATLALYVNGVFETNLALIGARTRETKPTANVPGGVVRFWDEVMVAVDIPNNATVRLQRDNGAVACTIDFLELETAPPPLTVPDATWVSVEPGTGDARARIVAALATANAASGSKKVWFPAGIYTVERVGTNSFTPISIPAGLEIRGAGIWHTTLVKNWSGANARLFRVAGTGNVIQDLKAVDTITTLSGNSSNCIFDVIDSTRCVLKGIWTEYASLAIAYGANAFTARDCRIRNGYKDAIHLATTAHDGLIENCTFRNTGDDCAAFVIYESAGATALRNHTARYNTMEGTYWGRSISLQGGDNNRAEYNLVRDSSMSGIMIAIDTWTTSVWDHNTNFLIRRNVVLRCGNQIGSAAGASISFSTPSAIVRPMSGSVEENTVLEPPFHGAQLTGNIGDATHTVRFQNNFIAAPTSPGGPPWARKQLNLLPGSNVVHTPNTDL